MPKKKKQGMKQNQWQKQQQQQQQQQQQGQSGLSGANNFFETAEELTNRQAGFKQKQSQKAENPEKPEL